MGIIRISIELNIQVILNLYEMSAVTTKKEEIWKVEN